MNVGDEWNLTSRRAHLAGDVFEVGGVDFCLSGDADNFASCIGQSEHLCDAGWGVARVGGDHRLHADRVVSAHAHAANHDLAGRSARIAEQVWAVAQWSGLNHYDFGYK